MSTNTPWSFVTTLYARPGVAERCIELQDRHGVDVTLLLFCCWVGVNGRALTSAELAVARSSAESWQRDVTGVLRTLRRRLKHDTLGVRADRRSALRGALLEVEIDAERIALQTLGDAVDVAAYERAAWRAAVIDNVTACLCGYGMAGNDARRHAERLADICAALAA